MLRQLLAGKLPLDGLLQWRANTLLRFVGSWALVAFVDVERPRDAALGIQCRQDRELLKLLLWVVRWFPGDKWWLGDARYL